MSAVSADDRELRFEVVIVQPDGTIDLRALFYASSDAVAFAEIRPGYYGAKWVARRRSDGRVVAATTYSTLASLYGDMANEKHVQVMDEIRPLLREHMEPAKIGEVGRAVKKALQTEGQRQPNWMALGHGTKILDILEES